MVVTNPEDAEVTVGVLNGLLSPLILWLHHSAFRASYSHSLYYTVCISSVQVPALYPVLTVTSLSAAAMVLGALVARRLGAALTERTASLGRALAGIQNSLTSWSVPPVAPQLEVAGFGVALPQASVRADEEADTEVEGQGPWLGHGSLQQLLKESIWFAVPKRKVRVPPAVTTGCRHQQLNCHLRLRLPLLTTLCAVNTASLVMCRSLTAAKDNGK